MLRAERHLRSPWRPQTSLLGLRLNKQVNGPRRPSFACESVFATRARHCGINGHFDRPAAFVARATRQNAQVPKRADKMAAKMALGMCKWNRLSSNTVHLKELLVLGTRSHLNNSSLSPITQPKVQNNSISKCLKINSECLQTQINMMAYEMRQIYLFAFSPKKLLLRTIELKKL